MITEDLVSPSISDYSLEKLLAIIKAKHLSWLQIDPYLPSWESMEPEVIAEGLVRDSEIALSEDKLLRLTIKVTLLGKLLSADDSPEFESVFYETQVIPKLVEIVNNVDEHMEDVERLSLCSSLQLSWFIDELKRVCTLSDSDLTGLNKEFKKLCAYVLHEEGCIKPTVPFSYFLTDKDLHEYWYDGKMPPVEAYHIQDLADKQKAIDVYLNLMRSRLC